MSDSVETKIDRRAWGVLPSEDVLWQGAPVLDVPRPLKWTLAPLTLGVVGLIAFAFAGLLRLEHMPGAGQTSIVGMLLVSAGVALRMAPHYLFDACQYLVTDKRVIWRNGKLRRSVERRAISFGRIRWHGARTGVGTLELVRAVPFGPFARSQRVVLHDLRAPDEVLALVRDAALGEFSGDPDVRLTDRLDEDEELEWGAHPEGWLVGWREALTAFGGVLLLALALSYGWRAGGIVVTLERLGLPVGSVPWSLLALAVGLTFAMMITAGASLFWYGLVRARSLARSTEYVLTNKRLLIRRGRTELSVSRSAIVDVASAKTVGGVHNIFLVLDAPRSKALSDSGALKLWPPPRDRVAPVLYELRDVEALRTRLGQAPRGSRPPMLSS